jgi:hypothetical protein
MKSHLVYAALLLVPLVPFLHGCTFQNPEWAESLNPCCGQDEVLEGNVPSEGHCADMVVSRESAMSLAWRMAGGGMTHWRVRLLPGGPACIYRKWPGLTEDDYAYALIRPDADSSSAEPAATDTASPEQSQEVPD